MTRLKLSLCAIIMGLVLQGAAHAQHGTTTASVAVPDSLRVRPQTAATGMSWVNAPPPPSRHGPTEPYVALASACRTCIQARQQAARPQQTAWTTRQILGRDPRSVMPWLKAISGVDPIVIDTHHASLVVCVPKAKVTDLTQAEVERLRVVFPGFPPQCTALTAHQVAHVWAERLLQVEAALAALLDANGRGWAADPLRTDSIRTPLSAQLFLFSTDVAAAAFAGQGLPPDTWALGGGLFDHGPMATLTLSEDDTAAQRRRFDWSAALQLMRGLAGSEDSVLPPWLEVGLADVIQARDLRAFALEPSTFRPGQEPLVDATKAAFERVNAGKGASIAALSLMPIRAIGPLPRAEAASLVRYLIALDPAKFALFVDELASSLPRSSRTKALSLAVRDTWNVDLVTLEAGWREWVLSK